MLEVDHGVVMIPEHELGPTHVIPGEGQGDSGLECTELCGDDQRETAPLLKSVKGKEDSIWSSSPILAVKYSKLRIYHPEVL